jgi:hypothetical protein
MFVYFDQTQSAAISLSVEIGFKASRLARAAPSVVPLEMVFQVRHSCSATLNVFCVDAASITKIKGSSLFIYKIEPHPNIEHHFVSRGGTGLRLRRCAGLCSFARFWRPSASGGTAGKLGVRRNCHQIRLGI